MSKISLMFTIKAGAHGGTILFCRGSDIHEKQKLLRIPIEPQKKVVLTVTYSEQSEAILAEIVKSTDLGKPGTGIAFVVPMEKVVGVSDLTGEVHHEM